MSKTERSDAPPYRDPLTEQILAQLGESPDVLKSAEMALKAALERRNIHFGDGLLPSYVVPFLINEERLQRWIAQSDLLAEAVEQIAQAALTDQKLYQALNLNPQAEALLRIEPGYRRIVQLARPDAVPAGQDLAFFEFNCDSPAMMNFADVLTECLFELPHMAPHKARCRPERMTQKLLDTLLVCYRDYGAKTPNPTIAITDWEGQKTRYEHRQIALYFEEAGYPTIVCDPRAFRRAGKNLEIEGRRVDIVYRRALFTEILARQSEVEALLGAYRDGTICMVNSLRSYLGASKTLLAFLCEDERFSQARRYIAATSFISKKNVLQLRNGERRHVLKRGESHGGQHVLLPKLATDEQWQRALDEAMRDPWIAQECYPVPTLSVPMEKHGRVEPVPKYFNWNPFIFAGRYAGGIARGSDTPLINITLGGGLLPTLPYV